MSRGAVDRRRFLSLAARTGGSMAAFAALGRTVAACTRGEAGVYVREGYGPLRPAGAELALPEGFAYRRLGVEGEPMSDGHETPRAHDGMAAFPLPNGNIRLIRNHEVTEPATTARPIGGPVNAYDLRGGGGTTSLEIHSGTREVVRDFVSLNGTVVNCAGGPAPWGAWLSCEENTSGPMAGRERPHGYVFEVPVGATGPVAPVPLVAMGRFVHEAVAVDPATGVVYLTEDARDFAGLYRFLPEVPYGAGRRGDLTAGGRLQMLAVTGRPAYDTRTGQTPGVTLPVRWVDIADPDPWDAETNPRAVFDQGFGEGAARFDRLEGAWYGDGAVYFDATAGGDAGIGQIWRYRPARDDLTLIFEATDPTVLKSPDNICVSPRGGIVVCEDPVREPHIRGLTPDGRVFDFARNIMNDREFAGATFSPDGRTLFVNIQGDFRGPRGALGMTFAIWGPWERGAL